MAFVPPEPIARSPRTRVKLYVLNDDRQWDDRGTGYVLAAKVERNAKRKASKGENSSKQQQQSASSPKIENGDDSSDNESEREHKDGEAAQTSPNAQSPLSTSSSADNESDKNGGTPRQKSPKAIRNKPLNYSLVLYVVNEQDATPLLRSRVRLTTGYQKQQETLIVWSDGGLDLALSFQEKSGCDDVWERICAMQGRDPSVDYTGTLNDSNSSNDSSNTDSNAEANRGDTQTGSNTSANAAETDEKTQAGGDDGAQPAEAQNNADSVTADEHDGAAKKASGNESAGEGLTQSPQRPDEAADDNEMDDDAAADDGSEEDDEPTFVVGSTRNQIVFTVEPTLFTLSSSNMSFVGSMGGVGPPFELPDVGFRHLPEIVEAFQTGSSNALKKERFTDALMHDHCEYLHRLCDLFRACEDLDAHDLLPHFYEIAKCLFVLNRHAVFEQLFSDESFYADIVGMLEYDPALNLPFQFADSQNASPTTGNSNNARSESPSNARVGGARPPTPASTPGTGSERERPNAARVVTLPGGLRRYNHREFLSVVVRFRQMFPFQRADIINKIHETFRIQYVLENILPTPTIFEENQFSGLTSFMFMNKLEIVNMVGDDENCLARLFEEIISVSQQLTTPQGSEDTISAPLTPTPSSTRERSRSRTEEGADTEEHNATSDSAEAKKDANANDSATRANDSRTEDSKRMERLTDLLQFLRELCSFTQSLTQQAKDTYYRRMASLGIMRAIEAVMRAPVDIGLRTAIIEVFSYVVEFAPAVVREYMMHDSQLTVGSNASSGAGSGSGSGAIAAAGSKSLFLNLIVELLISDDDPELSNAVQLSTVLRSLLDPDSMTTSATQTASGNSPYGAGGSAGSGSTLLSGGMKNEKTEFLKLLYAKCVPMLIAPLFEAIDGSSTSERSIRERERERDRKRSIGGSSEPSQAAKSTPMAPKRDDYRTAMLLANVVDLLSFFIERHNYHMKNLVNSRDLIRKVLVLLGSRHLFLVLTALRLFRRVVGLKDPFYTQHIMQTGCFQPVVDVFMRHASRHNLVNSATLELFGFICAEEVRPLIQHLVETFADRLRNALPVGPHVLRELQAKYDQYACSPAGSSGTATPNSSAMRHSAPFSLNTRRGTPLSAGKAGESDSLNGPLLLNAMRRASNSFGKRGVMINEEFETDGDDQGEYELSESLTGDQIRQQLSEQTKQLREAEREDAWFANDDDDIEVIPFVRLPSGSISAHTSVNETDKAVANQLGLSSLGTASGKDDERAEGDEDEPMLLRVNRSSNNAARKRRRLGQAGVGADADDDMDDDEDTDEIDRVWHQRFTARQNAYTQNTVLRSKLSRSSKITIRNGPYSLHASPNGATNTTNSRGQQLSGTVREKSSPNRDRDESSSGREQPSPPRSPASLDELVFGDVVVKSPVSSLVDYPDDEDEAQQAAGLDSSTSAATSSPLSSPPRTGSGSGSADASASASLSSSQSSIHSAADDSTTCSVQANSSNPNANETEAEAEAEAEISKETVTMKDAANVVRSDEHEHEHESEHNESGQQQSACVVVPTGVTESS